MNPRTFPIAVFLLLTISLVAQEPAAPEKGAGKPQVRVNYLNVCSPSPEERAELSSVLARITAKPSFGVDMEISRGRSTLNPSDLVVNTGQPATTEQKNSVSRWVRIRRDFPEGHALTSTQYSFSVSENHVSETLVFHFRDAKDVMQLSINDSVDSAADAGQVAKVQTPADRIRVERFGKSSIVLARCPTADQSQYEPIFGAATVLLNSYRRALNIAGLVPGELSRLGNAPASTTSKGTAASTKPGSAVPKPQ